MASNLYETLEVPQDAEPEQIRKAYKKKALETHPDRLPRDATPEQKAESEEMFRKVNNAYEVLSDPQNRRTYDQHGVWPPPGPEPAPQPRWGAGHHTHPQHRYNSPHGSPFGGPFGSPFFRDRHPFSFPFSDPFSLFDTVFGIDPAHRRSFRQHQFHSNPWMMDDPFESLDADPEDFFDSRQGGLGGSLFGRGFGFGFPPRAPRFPSPLASSSFTNSGNWAAESYSTTTINGVTESIHKTRDWNGNEHVTRTYPDGRTIRTINGVEQPSGPMGRLPQAPQYERPSRPWSPATLPPPPPYESTSSNPRDHGAYHDPQYLDSRPVIPDPRLLQSRGREDPATRKRWWPGRG